LKRKMDTSTKKTKILYWVSTALLALFVLPGIFFAGSKMALEGTAHLGLPMWFHWELSIGKFIGGLILIFPFFPKRIKEWAYVAFGIDCISAFIAIVAVDGTSGMWYSPIIFLIILIVSYVTFHQLKDRRTEQQAV
ncbi:MAG TPA: DoxX family protein, partial [Pedobacter sp.]